MGHFSAGLGIESKTARILEDRILLVGAIQLTAIFLN